MPNVGLDLLGPQGGLHSCNIFPICGLPCRRFCFCLSWCDFFFISLTVEELFCWSSGHFQNELHYMYLEPQCVCRWRWAQNPLTLPSSLQSLIFFFLNAVDWIKLFWVLSCWLLNFVVLFQIVHIVPTLIYAIWNQLDYFEAYFKDLLVWVQNRLYCRSHFTPLLKRCAPEDSAESSMYYTVDLLWLVGI